MLTADPRVRLAAAATSCLLAIACGQKGPPLAPLHLVPNAVTELSVRRVSDRAQLRFVLPVRNVNGPGPIELDHVEIYAITVPPGYVPPNRLLFSKAYLVGQMAVRPAPIEGEPPPAEDDKRPGPGDAVTFEDELTAEKLTPITPPVVVEPKPTGARPPGAAAAPSAPPTATAGAATPAAPTTAAGAAPPPVTATPPEPAPVPALPAALPPVAALPPEPAPLPALPGTLLPVPALPDAATPPPEPAPVPALPATPPPVAAPPGAATTPPPLPGGPPTVRPLPPADVAQASKPAAAVAKAPVPGEPTRVYVVRGVTKSGRTGAPSPRIQMPMRPVPPPPQELKTRITETAVVVEWKPNEKAPTAAFNVYRADDPKRPVNPALLKGPAFEDAGAKLGEERCYQVRSVGVVGGVRLEGDLSEPTCVTPKDSFPPAAPKGLAAVPTPGQISLIWDANTEKDLAGYLVLRGDAPDGALKAITPAPIKETSYRDTTVKTGVRYIYVIVAVDTATPPNTSAQSPRVEETAR
jgi:hypothetical protein